MSDAATINQSVDRSMLFEAEASHVTRGRGTFRVFVTNEDNGRHVVLVHGDVAGRADVLCRVSSACLMSTALLSAECDCSEQIGAALDRIRAQGAGVLIYLVDQEGRGHGLTWKIRALQHKNNGADTFEAVAALGLEPDVRDFTPVAPILAALDVRSVVLLTNNPDKQVRISAAGVDVSGAEPLEVRPDEHAWRHMEAKRKRGHTLSGPYVTAAGVAGLNGTGQVADGAIAAPTIEHSGTIGAPPCADEDRRLEPSRDVAGV